MSRSFRLHVCYDLLIDSRFLGGDGTISINRACVQRSIVLDRYKTRLKWGSWVITTKNRGDVHGNLAPLSSQTMPCSVFPRILPDSSSIGYLGLHQRDCLGVLVKPRLTKQLERKVTRERMLGSAPTYSSCLDAVCFSQVPVSNRSGK